MATTLENTLIRFNDGTTQSTAATPPPAASTSVAGVVQLTTSTDSTSTTLAATASAVKAAYDLAAGKADASHTHAYVPTDAGQGVGTFRSSFEKVTYSVGKTYSGSSLGFSTGTWRCTGITTVILVNSGETFWDSIFQRIS